jgi:hypothetical protein
MLVRLRMAFGGYRAGGIVGESFYWCGAGSEGVTMQVLPDIFFHTV